MGPCAVAQVCVRLYCLHITEAGLDANESFLLESSHQGLLLGNLKLR